MGLRITENIIQNQSHRTSREKNIEQKFENSHIFNTEANLHLAKKRQV